MKNFEEKIENHFQNLSISTISAARHNIHLYADFAELLCLVSNDTVSASSFVERFNQSGQNITQLKENLDGETGELEAELDDDQESLGAETFEHIKNRAELYGINYPFIIGKYGLKLKAGNLSNLQMQYLFLLIASSLKNFKNLQSILTKDFEQYSEITLKVYLSEKALVKSFGKNTLYKGNTQSKIKELADELNLEIRQAMVDQISKHNSQEEGLDIVAWLPFTDNNSNFISILAQCTCSQDWQKKQHETERYENFFDFNIRPIHVLFLPFALLTKQRYFEQQKDLSRDRVLFERHRLLQLATKITFEKDFLSAKIVKKCIDYQEDVV